MVESGAVLRAVGDLAGAPAARRPPRGRGVEARTGETSLLRVRIIDATLDCLALHGTAKTTVDDIARRAGVARATVYRAFPGGRDELLAAVVDTEMARLFSALGVCLGEAGDLADALIAGIVEASTRIRGHRALAYLVEHEPEMVLGHLAFDESDRLLATASRFAAPFLSRWMSPDEAGRVAEWATRIVLSYVIAPSASVDLCDPAAAARLVEQFVVPGIRALHEAGPAPAIDITPFERGTAAATTGPDRTSMRSSDDPAEDPADNPSTHKANTHKEGTS